MVRLTAEDKAVLLRRHLDDGVPLNRLDAQAGVDGINLINWRLPGSYEQFNEKLLPVLQRRGLAKTAYAEGTLRRKIFGRDRLPGTHPGARYRGAFAPATADV